MKMKVKQMAQIAKMKGSYLNLPLAMRMAG
jgi:hypothetical protein